MAIESALQTGAAFVACPCCVGKLKFSLAGGSSKSAQPGVCVRERERESMCCARVWKWVSVHISVLARTMCSCDVCHVLVMYAQVMCACVHMPMCLCVHMSCALPGLWPSSCSMTPMPGSLKNERWRRGHASRLNTSRCPRIQFGKTPLLFLGTFSCRCPSGAAATRVPLFTIWDPVDT